MELAAVSAGERAKRIGAEQGRDPRVVQVILDQSAEILREQRGVLINPHPPRLRMR